MRHEELTSESEVQRHPLPAPRCASFRMIFTTPTVCSGISGFRRGFNTLSGLLFLSGSCTCSCSLSLVLVCLLHLLGHGSLAVHQPTFSNNNSPSVRDDMCPCTRGLCGVWSGKHKHKHITKNKETKKPKTQAHTNCEAILFLEPKISMQSVQHCASRRRTRTLTNDEDRDYN